MEKYQFPNRLAVERALIDAKANESSAGLNVGRELVCLPAGSTQYMLDTIDRLASKRRADAQMAHRVAVALVLWNNHCASDPDLAVSFDDLGPDARGYWLGAAEAAISAVLGGEAVKLYRVKGQRYYGNDAEEKRRLQIEKVQSLGLEEVEGSPEVICNAEQAAHWRGFCDKLVEKI